MYTARGSGHELILIHSLQVATREYVFILDLMALCRQPGAGLGYTLALAQVRPPAWRHALPHAPRHTALRPGSEKKHATRVTHNSHHCPGCYRPPPPPKTHKT